MWYIYSSNGICDCDHENYHLDAEEFLKDGFGKNNALSDGKYNVLALVIRQ